MPDFGLGQMGAAAISGAFGLIGSKKQFQYATKLAEQQNQYNIDMWKMQAAYNSPQAQMQRYAQAGLNPNLIYGQGTSGNMSSAPEQVTPAPPEIASHLSKLGEAFNIEGLRTQIANRKKAQEEAKQAKLETLNQQDERSALHRLGFAYTYDFNKGQFIPNDGNVVVNNTGLQPYLLPTDLARMNKYLASVDPRHQLISTQRAYLQPQIGMLQYERKYQPWSFWIGNGAKALNALPLPKFNFRFGKPNTAIYSPKTNNRYFDQNIYNY